MKKALIYAMCLVYMLAAIAFGNTQIPTEVPPCPEEYKGGLVP